MLIIISELCSCHMTWTPYDFVMLFGQILLIRFFSVITLRVIDCLFVKILELQEGQLPVFYCCFKEAKNNMKNPTTSIDITYTSRRLHDIV